MKKALIFVVLLLLIGGAVFAFRTQLFGSMGRNADTLTLYGNVDYRQLNLAFLLAERIAQVIPEEGAMIKKGDLLGSLETTRLENDIAAVKAEITAREAAVQAAQALVNVSQAAVDVAQAVYTRNLNGSRPEDIAMARAGNEAVSAKLKAAEIEYNRQKTLRSSDATSEQTKESAEADFLFLNAGFKAVQSYLKKLETGERAEDIAAAKARLEQAQAELSRAQAGLLQAQAELERGKAELVIREQRLKDANLYAPCDGVIRNRLLEPGEMAAPQIPVLSLAVVSPKWVRCYLSETELTRVKMGDQAKVFFDGAETPFDGWVGFISPNAEFTPKNIETAELRTNLVYEMRVYVNDPENRLKLGAPATVSF